MLIKEIEQRLEGIRKILMAHHESGVSLPSAAKGSERETLIREFLAKIFPAPYRFGTGTIVDSFGSDSKTKGQCDIVVEFPILPSFPTPGAADRLYLADSIALVIEVKSNLKNQWKQVIKTATKVRHLRRTWDSHEAINPAGIKELFGPDLWQIPCLAVGYLGPKDWQELKNLIDNVKSADLPPDGAFVIDTGAYSGCRFNDYKSKGNGIAGFWGFCLDVAWLARNVIWAAPNLERYSLIADESEIDDVRTDKCERALARTGKTRKDKKSLAKR